MHKKQSEKSYHQIKLFSLINIANFLKKENIFYGREKAPKVLVAPLDWGLGHATRCIPIVNALLNQGCQVYIAAENEIFSLLKMEFPTLVFLHFPGYRVTYSRKRKFFTLKMVIQIPKILGAILHEKKWLERQIKNYGFDGVISDNRFGMFSKKIPCIYVTHQLKIITGNAMTERLAQQLHYFFIKKYTRCWIPDGEKKGLAGELSHPKKIPENAVYIGPLSRLKFSSEKGKKGQVLISLSGPEPQRSIFENIVLNQLKSFNRKTVMVRGVPGDRDLMPFENKEVQIFNHLPASEFNKAFVESEYVICRAGYSSIMDLAVIGKKAILIPTPGQTEQEYLATYLADKMYFPFMKQSEFSLPNAIRELESFQFKKIGATGNCLQKMVTEFVLSL